MTVPSHANGTGLTVSILTADWVALALLVTRFARRAWTIGNATIDNTVGLRWAVLTSSRRGIGADAGIAPNTTWLFAGLNEQEECSQTVPHFSSPVRLAYFSCNHRTRLAMELAASLHVH